MKKTTFLLILCMLSFCGCKSVKPVAETGPDRLLAPWPVPDLEPTGTDYSDQTTWVLGYFNLDRLKREPHSVWFTKGYDEYQFKTDVLNKLLEINKDDIVIKIVMGTWCPDSRREVPRFMKVLDMWQFPLAKVTFIGVDNAKMSPVGEYNKLDIQRVPTFIIYKNNIEKGRIIENPATSLEQDMVNILTRNE
ncbi:MAG: thioredoxin [Bacteroidetes bacterium]|nr:MAG: thioredoxin [Bacteroidota bacterium]